MHSPSAKEMEDKTHVTATRSFLTRKNQTPASRQSIEFTSASVGMDSRDNRCQVAALLLAVLVSATLPLAAVGGSSPEGIAYLEANKEKEGVTSLPSGLQYKVLREGEGTFHPTVDSPCECHYKGTLIDGTQFDSSYDRGFPSTFAPRQVIGGWTEAMQLMVEGDKWELYIPSDLAYGDRGSPPKIPGGATLVFTIEMLKIMGNKVPAAAQAAPSDAQHSRCHGRFLALCVLGGLAAMMM